MSVETLAPAAAGPRTANIGQNPVFSRWFEPAGEPSLRDDLGRVLANVAAIALFSLALAARDGALLRHALFTPLMPVLSALLVAPAYYVLTTHLGAAPEPRTMLRSLSRGLSVFTIMQAGLAPAGLMLVVTAETSGGAALFAWLSLLLSGALATRALQKQLLSNCGDNLRQYWVSRLVAYPALALMVLVVVRGWFEALPVLAGGR